MFFLVLALYFLQRAIVRGILLYILFTGVSAALATLIRSEGVGLLIVGALYLFYRGWIKGGLKRLWLQLGILFLGFVLFSAPYVLYLKWDTGNWQISRKSSVILTFGLAEYDSSIEPAGMDDLEKASTLNLIASRPFLYGRKVLSDAFRSLGVYFEALHYSYLPFLFIGWFFFFRGRFWEKEDFFLVAFIVFYLCLFALLYVNRRYAVPLVPVSLGWVGAGYLAFNEYFRRRWGRKGYLITGAALGLFLATTLPKTLKAIGREKLYLRQAGLYLREIPGNPTILTSNGRVAFYAEGQYRVLLKEHGDLAGMASGQVADYLALHAKVFHLIKGSLMAQGWLLDRKFSEGAREALFVLRQGGGQ
jgi:hypothetical protein